MEKVKLLAIDIGGGTQDILFYDEEKTIENCFKLVLPSQTVIIAKQIMKATEENRDICLTGHLMGGGACVAAMMNHIKKGLKVFALSEPAKTIKDNLEVVKQKGVIIVEDIPPSALEIELKDVDLDSLQNALELFQVEVPKHAAIAVQDHGENQNVSNRLFRFQHWDQFIGMGGDLKALTYVKPPDYLTRMQAIKDQLPNAILMDTGPAAVRGAMLDEIVKKYVEEGLIVVNVGNQHTFAVLVKGERIYGLFEHHTKLLSKNKLGYFVEALKKGRLTNEEIYGNQGHGAVIHPDYLKERPFEFITVTGPNRGLVKDLDYHMAVPFGDMMISGCFGLVEGFREISV